MSAASEARPQVLVTEVGPRDGLQNEKAAVPTEAKVRFVDALVAAGVRQIETTSFVNPQRVPAMADAADVFALLPRRPGVRYVALVPNLKGYERARAAGCDAIALFTAASEGFARANINMTIEQSLAGFRDIAKAAAADGVSMRGYVSTVFACPYDGPTAPDQVLKVTEALLDLGCYEVSLGDTIGVGTPTDTHRLLGILLRYLPSRMLALHFHDTWGMAVANVVAGLEDGLRSFDASAGGLGGCPYAPSASGNLATEDLVYLLDHLGYDTGIDLDALVSAGDVISPFLDHPLPGRVHQAVQSQRARRAQLAATEAS